MIKYSSLLFIALIVYTGCSTEDDPLSNNFSSTFQAKVGQEYWVGESYIDYSRKESQYIFFSPSKSWNYLYVKVNLTGEGVYPLPDSNAMFVETYGGDVLKGIYYSVGGAKESITISQYDTVNKFIAGHLNCSIKKDAEILLVDVTKFNARMINTK